MKKKTLVILVLVSIIVLVFGSAAAPMAGKTVKLLDSYFVPGKGVVFLFEATGLSKADLKSAFAYGGGNPLSVDCHFKNDDKVACTVKNVNKYAGQQVMISLAGFGFWSDVPGAFTCYGWSNTWEDLDGQLYTVYGPYNMYWTRADEREWAQWVYAIPDSTLVFNNTCVTEPLPETLF